MERSAGRLRQALLGDANAPIIWLTAVFAVAGVLLAATIAVLLGLRDVALAAGFVAALAGVAGSLVPPSLTGQVAAPAATAVAVAPLLALVGEGRPLLAGPVAAAVFAVGTLVQADAPTGRLAGALGSTAYVLAIGMALVRDVPLEHTAAAGVIGLLTAVLTTLGGRAVRGWMVRHGRSKAFPEVPALPGRFGARLATAVASSLRDWRHDHYVRLALRRVVALAPMVAALEWWRQPVALYALIVAFSVTQPAASDTFNRALARTAGTIAAIITTVAVAVLLPNWALVVFAALAMVAGLAYVLRSPFLTTLGTTVLTVASGLLAGAATSGINRLVATAAGATVAVLATVLIPVPRSYPVGSSDDP